MPTADKIFNAKDIVRQTNRWKQAGEKIVFTNGCFDILHLGHVDYLEKASSKGSKMVVAINTDASVKKLKGEGRPVNSEIARARILAALAFVDAVTFFSEDSPENIIHLILPDVLIKGSDYNISNIVGADIVMRNGGTVETIELVKGYSTTNIIRQFKQ